MGKVGRRSLRPGSRLNGKAGVAGSIHRCPIVEDIAGPAAGYKQGGLWIAALHRKEEDVVIRQVIVRFDPDFPAVRTVRNVEGGELRLGMAVGRNRNVVRG